jgi:hypothetical protein
MYRAMWEPISNSPHREIGRAPQPDTRQWRDPRWNFKPGES